MVQVPPFAATTKPFTHCVPDAGATMAKAPGPPVLATVGFAVNVSGPLPLLVTVIVPVLTVLVAGVVVSTGLGAEKPTTACRAVPLRAIGEPVTTSTAPPGGEPVTTSTAPPGAV